MNLSERVEPGPILAATQANTCMTLGRYRRHRLARFYGRLAVRTAEESRNPAAHAVALSRVGTYHLCVADWSGLKKVERAVELAKKGGARRDWEEGLSILSLSCSTRTPRASSCSALPFLPQLRPRSMPKTTHSSIASKPQSPITVNVTDVTGTKSTEIKLPATLPGGTAARSIATMMNLPENVNWTLRNDDSSAFLSDDRAVGEQLPRTGANLTLTPKTHLG